MSAPIVPQHNELISIGDRNPARFKADSLVPHRINEVLRENKVSTGLIIGGAIVAGALNVAAIFSGPAIVPVLGAEFACYALISAVYLRIVKKTYDRYQSRVRNFDVDNLLGLGDELTTSIYNSNSPNSYNVALKNVEESIMKSLDREVTPDEMIEKINRFFTQDTTHPYSAVGLMRGMKKICDKGIAAVNKRFGSNISSIRTPEEKVCDAIDDFMSKRLRHMHGEYVDNIPDLKVAQFHAYNHIIGFFTKCAIANNPNANDENRPAWMPRNIDGQWVREIHVKHDAFAENFLNESRQRVVATELMTAAEFNDQSREKIQKIYQYVRNGGVWNPPMRNQLPLTAANSEEVSIDDFEVGNGGPTAIVRSQSADSLSNDSVRVR